MPAPYPPQWLCNERLLIAKNIDVRTPPATARSRRRRPRRHGDHGGFPRPGTGNPG
jgi:hypothetical protein